ncbi:MAG: UspA [Deltaproteobacteria bacterium]|nr:UspA [Deltaproteobacteria bacterium]
MNKEHILIVEDDLNLLRSIEFILEAAGFEVSTGRNGREALEKIKLGAYHPFPDLFITDIQMPGLTGVKLIEEVRRMRRSVPVLVITAYGDRKLKRELIQRSCPHCLDKPFDEETLLEKVFAILEEKRGGKVMIPKIEKILYATDLSKNSAYAFRYAVNSAENHDAQIHIIHVLEKTTATQEALLKNYLTPEKLDQIHETHRAEAGKMIQKRLEEFCQKELQNRPEALKRVVSIQVVEGDPAGTILGKAEELKADTVIMGTHGKGFLEHAFLGSVAEKVLQRIKIPVFIVPIPEEKNFVARIIEKPKEISIISGVA